MKRRIAVLALLLCFAFVTMPLLATGQEEAKTYHLVGASSLPPDYTNYKALAYFADKVKEYYDGPIEIDVHHSAELGDQTDYIEYMIQGISVDFAMSAPATAATYDKRCSFLDPPFLYRDLDHWAKVLESDAFVSIEDTLLDKGLRILGYGGGGTRNLILRKEVKTDSDLPSVLMRVMGSPIQAKAFSAAGLQVTPMAYTEVYNAIKTGVVDGLENEASSLLAMKFYEVAPYVILTRHAITVRPIWFSEKRFQSFPEDLQQAILKAGAEAAAYHREIETKADVEALQQMADEGKIVLVEFDNTEMIKKTKSVLKDYATELGAIEVWENVDSIK
jgi:TRAP-type C4-dicarboxylate transport system substrate-binding protein